MVQHVDAQHADEMRVVLPRFCQLVPRGVHNVVVVRQLLVEEAHSRILFQLSNQILALGCNTTLRDQTTVENERESVLAIEPRNSRRHRPNRL